MSRSAQLTLVQPLTRSAAMQSQTSSDPTRRVFEHWMFMLARNPARCKMGPTRRSAINAALSLYDEDQLLMAIDGMASDPLDDCSAQMVAAMRELEWLLAKESRIERWADRGDRLHRRADRLAQADAQRAQLPTEPDEPVHDLAAAAAGRERLRSLAASMRGRGGDCDAS